MLLNALGIALVFGAGLSIGYAAGGRRPVRRGLSRLERMRIANENRREVADIRRTARERLANGR